MYYTGNNLLAHPNGVTIIFSQKIDKCVTTFVPYSDRMMLLKIRPHRIDINIIQAYTPTAKNPDIEINNFYSALNELLNYMKKNETNLLFMTLILK